MVVLGFICIKAVMNPSTHRLSPDIGTADDEFDKEGQVTGFHYRETSWWGFRKKTHDRIRFVAGRGPQYFDESSAKWREVPPEAWDAGMGDDDRTMETDNHGSYEQ